MLVNKSMWSKHFVVSKKRKSYRTDLLSPNDDYDDDIANINLKSVQTKVSLYITNLSQACSKLESELTCILQAFET